LIALNPDAAPEAYRRASCQGDDTMTMSSRDYLALMVATTMTACAVEVQNKPPVEAKAAGSVYTGWRVFQDRCARCHGASANGAAGPDLVLALSEMSERRFTSVVLYRYEWSLEAARAGEENAAREALIDEIMKRRDGALAMPAWQGEPSVSAHIADLYAYLSARAEGTQGPGRPPR
jgi:mono/diheme cytochrome c family protein